jgi:hypothetical protein
MGSAFRALMTISYAASTSKPQVLNSHRAENTLLLLQPELPKMVQSVQRIALILVLPG